MNLPNKQKILVFVKKLINKKTIISIIFLLVLYSVATRNTQDSKKIQTAQVQNKTLISNISASGVIRSENEAILHFNASGKLAWVNIKQGDHVNKFQAVAKLNTQDLEKSLKKDLNLYLTQRTNFDDTKNSQKDQVITDTLKRIAQRAQNSLENTVTDVEIQDLAIKYSTIYSPIDGFVVNNPQFFAGNNVSITDSIATIEDLSSLEFIAEIDESDIEKTSEGQTASIKLDAFSDKSFNATIETIVPKAISTSTGSTAFQAIFKMPENEKLKIGMNGTVEVETNKVENALSVPLEAIIDNKYVYVLSGKKFVKKEVEKGIESDTEAQITSGLEKDNKVLTSGVDELKKGSIFQKITGSAL